MADTRDPRAIKSEGWLNKPDEFQGLKIPEEKVNKDQLGTEFYAYQITYANGDRVIKWYKRSTGDGKNDPLLIETNDTVSGVKEDWDKETRRQEEASGKKEVRTYPGTDPTTGLPAIVTEYSDGTRSYDSSKPPSGTPTPRTSEQQATEAANARTAQASAQTAEAENKERQWNSQNGHGWVTHAQRDAAIRAEQAQARADQNVARQAAAQEASNQLARDRLQFDRDKANLPTVKVEDKSVNGTKYTTVTTVTPDGKTVGIRNYGPDGKPVDRIPSEGEASRGGPRLPANLAVRDASVQALTAYHEALWNDPTLTPEQREKRFQEAVQVANITGQQWTADEQRRATEQRERESVRNAEYNVAVQRLGHMQSGTSAALDFVSKQNGWLPENSSLGGQAFMALLGLNMLQMQMSGINTLPSLSAPGSSPRPAPPTVTAADLSNPQRLAEVNQEITQQAAQAAAAPPAPPQQNAGMGTGEPPSRAALPAQPSTPPPAVGPVPSAAPMPPDRPDQFQAAPQIEDAINPPAAPPGIPPQYPDMTQVPMSGTAPYIPPPGPPDGSMTGAPIDRTSPGAVEVPDGPSQYGGGEDMQKLSFGDWPALAGLGAPMAQAPAPAPMPAQPGAAPMEPPPALRRAQISITPPWRLQPDDFAWARANGLLDDALAVPGRRV